MSFIEEFVHHYKREQIHLCAYWTVYHGAFPPHSVAGSDYTLLTVNLTFNATTNQNVTIMAFTDDVVETQEVFTLSLISDDSAVMPQSVLKNISIIDMTGEYIHRMKETTKYTECG